MKKLLFLSVAAFVLVAAANAQANSLSLNKHTGNEKEAKPANKKRNQEVLRKLEGTEVSPLAKQEFYNTHGNIPAVWKRTLNYDQASFTQDGEACTAYYDADAKLVGTLIQKKFEDLPDDSQKYINEKYPDYDKEAVAFYDDNELNTTDIVVFNRQFDDEDCFYVELKKGNDEILVKAKQTGEVTFFKKIK